MRAGSRRSDCRIRHRSWYRSLDRPITQSFARNNAVIRYLGRTLDLEIDDAESREETIGKAAVSIMGVVFVDHAVLTKGHAEEFDRECQLV